MKSFTSILTIVTVFNLLLSGASGFISPASSSPASLTSSLSLKAVPENFSDIAETISDAARSLRGQTVVVKYGGVCEKKISLKSYVFILLLFLMFRYFLARLSFV
jgi:hypothetical protein